MIDDGDPGIEADIGGASDKRILHESSVSACVKNDERCMERSLKKMRTERDLSRKLRWLDANAGFVPLSRRVQEPNCRDGRIKCRSSCPTNRIELVIWRRIKDDIRMQRLNARCFPVGLSRVIEQNGRDAVVAEPYSAWRYRRSLNDFTTRATMVFPDERRKLARAGQALLPLGVGDPVLRRFQIEVKDVHAATLLETRTWF
ncbi:unnamed protein product [Aphanomyces euteiches]